MQRLDFNHNLASEVAGYAVFATIRSVALTLHLPLRAKFSAFPTAQDDRALEMRSSHQAEHKAPQLAVFVGLALLLNIALAAIPHWAGGAS